VAAAIVLYAHQGGWDEMLLVAGPIVAVVALLRLAERRARRAREGREDDADEVS